MVLYSFKRVKGKRIIEWNKNRGRGLKKAKLIIGDLEKEVRFLLRKKNKIKILEVGSGYGRALLELKKIFGNNIETYGINKEPRWTLRLIRKYGISNKIFSNNEINKNLPKLKIFDVDNGIPYASSSFDLVFSERVIQYLRDKAKYLEELNRVVKKGGLVITDIQDGPKDKPPERQHRWSIYDKRKRIDIKKILKNKKNIFIFKEKENPQDIFIKMIKDNKFSMGLKLMNSLDLHKINPDWYGVKSVFVKTKNL